MHVRKMRFFILSLLLMVFLLSACEGVAVQENQGEQDGGKTVAVVTPYMANETTKYVIEQFKAEGEDLGWEVTVTDTAGDFNMLVSRIEDAVAQNVDAIVLGMGDPNQMTKGLEAASAAGIPVFGLDAGVTDGVLLNVTSDNSALGQTSAQALIDAMGGEGTVIMFTHDPHPGVNERARAAEATFADAGIEVIEKFHIDVPGPLENARSITEDVLTSYPDAGAINGIWAGWDEPALGAVQAIEAAGRSDEFVVVGIDGTDFAQEEIAKGGPFVATVAQDFDAMASTLAGLVDGYFGDEAPSDEWYKIPGQLITGE